MAYVRAAARGHLWLEDQAPETPVGLVLGAQVYPTGRPSRFLRARLELGVRLYRRSVVRALLLSGDANAPEYDEPAAMRAYLVARGVPASKILLDEAGYDTYDSCYRAQDVFGLTRVLVLTQSYHLPRAVGTARLLGLGADGVGDDSVSDAGLPWVRGAVRDQVACVKTVLDLASHRRPFLGPSRASEVSAALELVRAR